MLKMLQDPIWQFVGIIISIIISLFADAPIIIRVVLCIAILGVFFIAFLFRKQSSSASEKGNLAGGTSSKPTNPVDISAQGLPLPPHKDITSIEKLMRLEEQVPEQGSAIPPSYENVAPAVTGKPRNTESVYKQKKESSSFSWDWEAALGFVVMLIMFGVPGILLFRSSVQWQHIVGIIILIWLALAVIGIIIGLFPESSGTSGKTMDEA